MVNLDRAITGGWRRRAPATKRRRKAKPRNASVRPHLLILAHLVLEVRK